MLLAYKYWTLNKGKKKIGARIQYALASLPGITDLSNVSIVPAEVEQRLLKIETQIHELRKEYSRIIIAEFPTFPLAKVKERAKK